jgi:hypothetical protein
MKTLLLLLQLIAQCPTFTMTGNYEEFTYCGEENEPYDPSIPCGFNTTYYTVEFEAQMPYTTINVTSQMNYIFAPTTPWNFAHLQLFDGCGGNQVWNTSSGACAVGGNLALTGEHPAQNYSVDLALPAGTYILVFGYASIPEQFGCVTVGIGNPTFLDLKPEDHGAGRNHWGEKKQPRYTKVVIEGRGVFIRDNHTGEVYDLRTRLTTERKPALR